MIPCYPPVLEMTTIEFQIPVSRHLQSLKLNGTLPSALSNMTELKSLWVLKFHLASVRCRYIIIYMRISGFLHKTISTVLYLILLGNWKILKNCELQYVKAFVFPSHCLISWNRCIHSSVLLYFFMPFNLSLRCFMFIVAVYYFSPILHISFLVPCLNLTLL